MRRRRLLMGLAGLFCMPRIASGLDRPLEWGSFLAGMQALALQAQAGDIAAEGVAARGTGLLGQLDVASEGFRRAVEQSWESGNRHWLWQRMVKEPHLNGGVLTVTAEEDVPLHDHPGATGMLRVLTGKLEVRQYDLAPGDGPDGRGVVELHPVSLRTLGAGDTAFLLPDKGNIHSLRSAGARCSMLDFFVPPYRRRERSWYLPVADEVRPDGRLFARRVSEEEYLAV